MNPLPVIIKELPSVLDPPPVIQLEEIKFDPAKKFILCITKDLKEKDKALFKDYKFVEYDDDIHRNVPIHSYEWDFLVLDLREKQDRYVYMKEVTPAREKYIVLVYCHSFEADEPVDVDANNVITSFPARQARKEDFQTLLMMKRIKKPKWWVSLFSCILSYAHKIKN